MAATRETTRTRTVLPATGAALLAAILLTMAACGGRTEEARQAAASPPAASPGGAQEGGGAGSLAPRPAHPPALTGQEALPPGHPPITDQAGGAGGHLSWTAPKEWVEEAPKSGMRRAQYRLPAAAGDAEDGECVVYYFGAGQGGDVQANIERWAAQFSGPGSESPRITQVKAGDLSASRVEVSGTYTPSPMMMTGGPAPQPKPGYMLLGAIVPGPDANWFFKCAGPAKTMTANRARFDALLASVRVER